MNDYLGSLESNETVSSTSPDLRGAPASSSRLNDNANEEDDDDDEEEEESEEDDEQVRKPHGVCNSL